MARHEKKHKRRGGWFWRLALPAALIGGMVYLRRMQPSRPWESQQPGDRMRREPSPAEEQMRTTASDEMAAAGYPMGQTETYTEGKTPAQIYSWSSSEFREDVPGRENVEDLDIRAEGALSQDADAEAYRFEEGGTRIEQQDEDLTEMSAPSLYEVESPDEEMDDFQKIESAREGMEMPVTGIDASPTMEIETETQEEDREMPPGEPDDLKLIEGIGPSISGLLRNNGITTFEQLANASIGRLDKILQEANLRRIADPSTWPEQARFAADGDWDGLEQFQRTLRAGRRVE